MRRPPPQSACAQTAVEDRALFSCRTCPRISSGYRSCVLNRAMLHRTQLWRVRPVAGQASLALCKRNYLSRKKLRAMPCTIMLTSHKQQQQQPHAERWLGLPLQVYLSRGLRIYAEVGGDLHGAPHALGHVAEAAVREDRRVQRGIVVVRRWHLRKTAVPGCVYKSDEVSS